MEEQKKENVKPIEVEEVKEYITEHNTWEKEENLENAKELVNEFEERLGMGIRR